MTSRAPSSDSALFSWRSCGGQGRTTKSTLSQSPNHPQDTHHPITHPSGKHPPLNKANSSHNYDKLRQLKQWNNGLLEATSGHKDQLNYPGFPFDDSSNSCEFHRGNIHSKNLPVRSLEMLMPVASSTWPTPVSLANSKNSKNNKDAGGV
nr:uncharacterized protein LOC108008225 [Drosophila suzukii]